ncbi:uncharacterized protein LOC120519046 [Polypterus senegalus]|uniref:uncharacterized protein LOC120519046 n=1 Tax=Polypterus senegalus TaxID=55291 RepID=UPI001963EBD7|nr:uncharacterized protein LOC120519046 [Polypterus senegalus]
MHPSEFCWIVWLMLVTSTAYAEKPKVALKIKNQKEPLHIGDNVTLECSIESDLPNWKYRWHKWSSLLKWTNIDDSSEGTHTHSVFSYEIELYWCAAVRDDHPYYFEMSNAVTVSVQDKPKATLKKRKPENIGDTLTLKCSFEGGFTGWRYTWLKLNWTGRIGSVKGITGDTYTVQSVTQSDTGVYWCAGERDEHPQYTKLSNAVTLSFQEKPKVTLKMRNQSELFFGSVVVTLECRIEGVEEGY